MIRDFLKGEPIGLSLVQIQQKVRLAAAKGDRDARALESSMVNAGRWPRRAPRNAGITPQLLACWCCPACGAAAASASGRDGTVKCTRGHARAAHPEERSPFLRKLLGQQ